MGCSFSTPRESRHSQSSPVSSKRGKSTDGSLAQNVPKTWNWDSAASANTHQHGLKSVKPIISNGAGRSAGMPELPSARQRSDSSSQSRRPSGSLPSRASARDGSHNTRQNRQEPPSSPGIENPATMSSLTSSGRLAHEMAGHMDGRFEDSDEDSDWDRYSFGDEDDKFSSAGTGSARNLQANGRNSGQLDLRHSARVQETSIFGLTDKRRLEPLRETKSLKLAKLRGCTFVNQYVVIKYLGRGACGRVFLCMDMNDNRLYAVKIVKKVDLEAQRGPRQNQRRKRNPIDDLRREVSIMRTLRHKNIVSLQEVVDDPSGNKMLLVMDYMEGGPVMTREALERGRCIPESLACQYFRDMCKALDYLHFNKVVHGDLKPENVLMSARGSVTLSDFGCSKVIISGNEYLERCNGTPAFLAPEMMRPQSRYRGRPTDVYALGACLYTFVFGRIPFNAPNVFKLFQVVQNEPLRFPDRPQVSTYLQDLLVRMLHKDPKQRITMARVMKHPWVTKRGQWPLRSVREMMREHGKVVDNEEPELPDLMSTYNVLDVPRQDHLLDVLRPNLPERSFRDGDILLRQGEQGTHLMYLLQGQVEVLVKLQPLREPRGSGRSGRGNENDGRSSELHTKPTEAVQEVIGDDLPPALLEGASKAKEFTSTLARGPREFLVAVRSEGQFVGEMASFTTAAVRCATVKAKGNVRVKVIPGELLHDCVERIPEARQQAKEMLWMRQSENMVLEAMTRLSSVHDALEEMLGGAVKPILTTTPGLQSRGNSFTSNASSHRQAFKR